MTPVDIGDGTSIPEFLQYAYQTWLEFPYAYREGERLVGIVDTRSAVQKNAGTVNINDLMELAVSALSQEAVRNLACRIVMEDFKATLGLRECLNANFAPDSDEAREAATEAALRLDPGYQTPAWEGETLDELRVWMIRWLLRPKFNRLLKQQTHEGLSAHGRFHKRYKELVTARGHTRAAA